MQAIPPSRRLARDMGCLWLFWAAVWGFRGEKKFDFPPNKKKQVQNDKKEQFYGLKNARTRTVRSPNCVLPWRPISDNSASHQGQAMGDPTGRGIGLVGCGSPKAAAEHHAVPCNSPTRRPGVLCVRGGCGEKGGYHVCKENILRCTECTPLTTERAFKSPVLVDF